MDLDGDFDEAAHEAKMAAMFGDEYYASTGEDLQKPTWDDDLDDVVAHMKKHYELKVRGRMSGEPTDTQEITILNRRLTWKGDVMTYEADPKHADIICEKFGLCPDSKGLTRPCVKERAVNVGASDGC